MSDGPVNGSGDGAIDAEERPRSLEDVRMEPAIYQPWRAELLVSVSFIIGILGGIGFGITYWYSEPELAMGVMLALALGGIGVGMTAWGKYLMPRGPFMEDRHELSTTEEDKARFAVAFDRGATGIRRRSFLGKLLGAAMGIFGVVAVFPLLRSLGPQPKGALFHTSWRKGSRLVGVNGRPIHVNDLEVGGVTTVFPEGDTNSAVSQTILLRAGPAPITTQPGRETWSPDGYLAFSKVCTHAGCPVGLYEEQFQQLLCPCHQSLFDVLTGCKPVFGPAPRPLPQLPLYADRAGYLRAQAGYDQPIGPSFWERSS